MMNTSEHISDFTQHFFEPAMVEQISSSVSVSSDKAIAALKEIVPEFFTAIIQKASLPNSADELLHFIHSDGINNGEKIIDHLFGETYSAAVDRVNTNSQLDSDSTKRMMVKVAPLCMGLIGTKVKNDNLNVTGLLNYIHAESNRLAGYNAETSEYYKLSGRDPDYDSHITKDDGVWKSWVLALIAAASLMAWWETTVTLAAVH